MAHAYTPGLKVTDFIKIRKERRLPLSGEVIVKVGEIVKPEQIVAKTSLPGNVKPLNVAGLLGCLPAEIDEFMKKKPKDPVKKNEVIAETKGIFGAFKSSVRSPIDGTIESISNITGQIILREPPQPVEVDAYIQGKVVEIIENEGVIIEAEVALIQGIFGIGGEKRGIIKNIASSPTDIIDERMIKESFKDKILAGGSLVTEGAIRKAMKLGIKGIITGGIEDTTIKNILGHDIGVAITGSENIPTTVIVTEGFGKMQMAEKTFNLLKSLENKEASINGATQIRAGVIRPEVIVAAHKKQSIKKSALLEEGLKKGMMVRIIREPEFGSIGFVEELPVNLENIETESKVRVLVVKLKNGKKLRLPRANVEIIED